MSAHQNSSLAQVAAENGETILCAGNLPLDMSNPLSVWYVEKGTVDLFLTETENDVVQAAQQHVLRSEAGRLLFGVAKNTEETTLALSAKGLPGTQLRQLTWTDLETFVDASELAFQIDCWIADVSSILSRYNIETTRPQGSVHSRVGRHLCSCWRCNFSSA